MAVIKNDRDVALQGSPARIVSTTASISLTTGIFNIPTLGATTPSSITLTSNTTGYTAACVKTWHWASNATPNTWNSLGTGDTKVVTNTDFITNKGTGNTIQYRLVITEFGYEDSAAYTTITQNVEASSAMFVSLLSAVGLPAADSNGVVAILPTGNAIRLHIGATLIGSGVVYSGTATQNGLTLTVNSSTGAITLTQSTWSSSTETFILTATYNSVAYTTSYTISKAINGVPIYDATPPPTAEGLSVTAGIGHLYISCNQPVYTQGHGHDLTVVYGAKWPIGDAVPTFSSAVELMRFQGTFSSYASDPSTRWCIWIKWLSNDRVLSTSPAGGTNGVQATTGQDVSKLVTAMTGAGNPFTILSTSTVIGGVTFPAGTYSTQSFVIDGQITNAKITNLAVDNAKIANMSVAKLTAGGLAVGQYVRSTSYTPGSAGFSINADGTAEFNNVTVRGTVYATAGEFRGVDVKNSAGVVILSSGSTIQSQIAPYQSGATVGATWGSDLAGKPADSALLNSAITLSSTGALNGAGGGQVKTIPVVDVGGERSTDRPPSWYPVGTTREFKESSAVGLGGADNYLTLETIIQYGDSSGGSCYQYAYRGTTTWRRWGTAGAASWTGAWTQDLDRTAYTGDLNATFGATWGTNLAGKPADAEILNNSLDGALRIPSPGGGGFNGGGSGMVGYLKITLPQDWSSTMVKFTVDIYEFQTGYSCTLEIGGYTYAYTNTWLNVTARVVGSSNVEYPVRFGNEASKCCVWIGTSHTDVWEYPVVRVRDFMAGYSNYAISQWAAGWNVSLDAGSIAVGTGHRQYSAEVLDTLPGVNWSKVSGSGRPADNATADVTLINANGMTISGNTATKTGGVDGAGDSGFYSKESYPCGVYISFVVSQATKTLAVGLNSDPLTNASLTSLDYAINCQGNGLLTIIEAGSFVLQNFASYVAGDAFAIIADGSTVRYLKNGTVLHTTVASPAGSLFADSSFGALGGAVSNIRFGPTTSNAWGSVGGAGKPADDATKGATIGVDLNGQITAGNASTFIADAAINNAQIGTLNASKINAGFINAGRIAVGTATALSAAGRVISSATIPTNATTSPLSTGTLVTFTSSGAPMTIICTLDFYIVGYTSGTTISLFDVDVMMKVDGGSAMWPNNSYTAYNRAHFPASGPVAYGCLPIVFRNTFSAGTHTISFDANLIALGTSNNVIAIYSGYWNMFSSIIATENKV